LEPLYFDEWNVWRVCDESDEMQALIHNVFERAIQFLSTSDNYNETIPVPVRLPRLAARILRLFRKDISPSLDVDGHEFFRELYKNWLTGYN
jgi:hypothetical protein